MLTQGKLLRNVLVMNMEMQLEDISASMYGKEISALTAEQVYIVVVCMVKGLLETFVESTDEKKLYYISDTLEQGGFLEHNLRNLEIYDILEDILVRKGQTLSCLKKVEENYVAGSGVFEQASEKFFQESRRLGMPAEAMGIRLVKSCDESGMFGEAFDRDKSWLAEQEERHEVVFCGIRAKILGYSMDFLGQDKKIYKFHLYDLWIGDEVAEEKQALFYDYFLAVGSVRKILKDLKSRRCDLRKMDAHIRIVMEGKYVTFVIPELIRILVEEKAIPLSEAVEIVRKVCGYEDTSDIIESIKRCPSEYVKIMVPFWEINSEDGKRETDGMAGRADT